MRGAAFHSSAGPIDGCHHQSTQGLCAAAVNAPSSSGAHASASMPTTRTTVVLTREAGKNGKMQKALSQLGYHCLELPLIEHTAGPDKCVLRLQRRVHATCHKLAGTKSKLCAILLFASFGPYACLGQHMHPRLAVKTSSYICYSYKCTATVLHQSLTHGSAESRPDIRASAHGCAIHRVLNTCTMCTPRPTLCSYSSQVQLQPCCPPRCFPPARTYCATTHARHAMPLRT